MFSKVLAKQQPNDRRSNGGYRCRNKIADHHHIPFRSGKRANSILCGGGAFTSQNGVIVFGDKN